jgi:rhamnopyranosyl-N-acetylglucosaminyl-diphospho-decaprenol beta-1,3/1,4-galactofuranosyltransferase
VPESEREKITAVVVTHNRKCLLGECLDSLLRQTRPLDGLYIIDNRSTDGTYESLLDRGLAGPLEWEGQAPLETVRSVAVPDRPDRPLEVHYVRMPENTGGAGGFHEGMKRAADAGFDWLWLMDDDLLAAADALEVLVRKKDALEAVRGQPFLLNSLVLDRDVADGDRLAFPLHELSAGGGPRIGVYYWRLSQVRDQVHDGLYRWACPFNGTFVPGRITTEVGLPNRDFFIWGDERDFLWRAARQLDLYTAVDSRVYHPRSRDAVFDWRQYYNIRNTLVLNRYFRYTRLRNLKLILVSLARGLRHGRGGLALVLRAIRDGLSGRLGRRDDLTAPRAGP